MKRFLIVFGIALSPLAVLAQNVTLTENITVILPDDSSTYTMQSNSKFDSLTVGTTDFSFSMSGGMLVDIVSSDKKTLTNSLNIATACESSQSRVYLALDPGTASQTVTITPTGDCSAGGGGGGGGGNGPIVTGSSSSGGGGGYSPPPAPPPIVLPPATPVPVTAPITREGIQLRIAEIQAQIAALTESVTPSMSTISFANDMNFGQRGDDVRRLQELLATDKNVYSEGIISGYYGTLTRNAVRRFQLKYGVIKSENDLGNGRTGPKTRAKLNEIFGASAPSVSVSPSVTGGDNSAQINLIQNKILEIQQRINALLSE